MSQPASPSARRLSAPARRAAILDAAIPLFASEGYARASINAIAAATGTTKPLIYDHFGSKQGLYLALLERESALMVRDAMDGFDASSGLDVRLAHLADAAIRFVRKRPGSARILLRTPDGDKATREAHLRLRRIVHDLATRLILADAAFAAADGLSRAASASLQADLQTAALERLALWALDHPRAPARALSAAFVDLLWNGLAH